jgi:lysophospholipase L1-like esterase
MVVWDTVINNPPVTNVYNAKNGLVNFSKSMDELNQGTNKIININCIGDGVTVGYNASTDLSLLLTKGYAGLLSSLFRKHYDDVGRGLIPSFHPIDTSTKWIKTGTWTANHSGSIYSIMGENFSTSENEATISLTFYGTGINTIIQKGPLQGTFKISIDGNAQVTYDAYDTSNYADKIIITGLSNSQHTLTITKTSDGKPITIIGAYETKGIRGIRVNNMGRGGTGSIITQACLDTMNSNKIFSEENTLTIIALGVNNYNVQTPISQFRSSMIANITSAKTRGDVILMYPSIRGNEVNGSITQKEYVDVLSELAEEYNCCFVNMFERFIDFSTATANGYILDGVVHPSQLGHNLIASILFKVLMPHFSRNNVTRKEVTNRRVVIRRSKS